MKPQCRKDKTRLAQFDFDYRELKSSPNFYRGIRAKQENDSFQFWHGGAYRGAAKTLALMVQFKGQWMADNAPSAHYLDMKVGESVIKYDPERGGWIVNERMTKDSGRAKRACERAEYMRVSG